MNTIIYEFDHIPCQKCDNYIFQFVHDRKLSTIYHSHDFYELFLILNGSCTSVMNEKEFLLNRYDFCILRPDDRHSFCAQSDDLQLLGLSVKKNEFEKIVAVYNSSFQNAITQPTEPIVFRGCAEMPMINFIYANFCASTGDYDYKLLLFCLIQIYLKAVSQKENDLPSHLRFAMSEIRKREHLKAGVSAFIKLSNYSQSHLSRLMKKYFHTTIQAYILNLKLEAAYNDLILTSIRAEEISEDIGFKSFSHFNKVFKEKYGITPAALRKTHGTWTT